MDKESFAELFIGSLNDFQRTGKWDQDLTPFRLLGALSGALDPLFEAGYWFPLLEDMPALVDSAKSYTWNARRPFAFYWLGSKVFPEGEGNGWPTGFDHYNQFIDKTIAEKYGDKLQPTENGAAEGGEKERTSRLVGSRRFLLDMAAYANGAMQEELFVQHVEAAWWNGAVFAGLRQGEMKRIVTPTSKGKMVRPASFHPDFITDLIVEIEFLSELHGKHNS